MAGKKKSHKWEANPKQLRFIQEYPIDMNATQAAIRAGYSEKTAGSKGHALLQKVEISTAIQLLINEGAQKCGLTMELVLRNLKAVVDSDLRRVFKDDGGLLDVKAFDDDSGLALASVETDELWEGQGENREQVGVTRKVRNYDKVAGIDKALKYLGGYEEHNKQKKDETNIQININTIDISGMPLEAKMKKLQSLLRAKL